MNLEMHRKESETIIVCVNRLFDDLTQPFLEHRREDVEFLRMLLRQGNFDDIRELGHEIKGTAGAYGFPGMVKIGRLIEEAAMESMPEFLITMAAELEDYLDRVEVVFK